MKYLLGVDLGTTAVKVGLFDSQARKICSSTQEYRLITESHFVVEQEVSVYWDAFKAGLREVLAESRLSGREILALSVSAQGETMVFLDEAGRPLSRAIVWMDNRAQEEARFLAGRFDPDEIHRATGQTDVIPLSPGCKVLWFKRNRPALFERLGKILLLEDWFFFRLCGETFGEGSLWCSTHMWDIRTRDYWEPMLRELGVRRELLPKIVESGTPLPAILPEVAAELGLSEEILLVMGGLDQSCGALGVGNARPGILSESTGAAMVVCTLTERPAIDPHRRLSCFYTAIPGMYMIHGFSSGGIALKWLRDALCAEESAVGRLLGRSAYALMDMEAAAIPPGSEGLTVLPHFQGAGPPDTDIAAKCLIYGLGLNHTKAHIIRAYLEAVAASLCRIVEAVEEMGIPVTEIRSLSGGAQSPLWCQIKADMLGRPLLTMQNTEDAACLGAALLAGAGAKLWPSVQEISLRIARERERYLPAPENRAPYDDLLRRYKLLTAQLRGITSQL